MQAFADDMVIQAKEITQIQKGYTWTVLRLKEIDLDVNELKTILLIGHRKRYNDGL